MTHPKNLFDLTYGYINKEGTTDLPVHSPMTAGAYSRTYTPRPDGGSVTESDPDNPTLLGLIRTSRVIGASDGLFKPISNKALFYKRERVSIMFNKVAFSFAKRYSKVNNKADVPDMRISWPGFLVALEAQRLHSMSTTRDTVIPPLFRQSPAVHPRHYPLPCTKSKKNKFQVRRLFKNITTLIEPIPH